MTELKDTLLLLDWKRILLAAGAVLLAAGLVLTCALLLRKGAEAPEKARPGEAQTAVPEQETCLVSRAQLDRMTYTDSVLGKMRWELSDKALAELNRVLVEYDITSVEEISQFLAQAAVESLAGTALTEWGDEGYFRSRGYSVGTRGAGYLHLTFAYGQMAFAVWLMKKYVPALSEIRYVNPADYGREEISAAYHAALQTAAELGLDVSVYTRVVYDWTVPEGGPSTGADYIAASFAWESAAYFWRISGIRQAFLNVPCSLNTDIASKIVGGANWQSRREAYAAYYPVLAGMDQPEG